MSELKTGREWIRFEAEALRDAGASSALRDNPDALDRGVEAAERMREFYTSEVRNSKAAKAGVQLGWFAFESAHAPFEIGDFEKAAVSAYSLAATFLVELERLRTHVNSLTAALSAEGKEVPGAADETD